MEITVSEEDLERVYAWAKEGREQGTRYRAMTYEDGVMETIDWILGNSDCAPDAD